MGECRTLSVFEYVPHFCGDSCCCRGNREPFIIRNLDIGSCRQSWKDTEYLKSKGGSRQVAVHVSEAQNMDFLSKNFKYKTSPFDVLVDRCSEWKHSDFFFSETELYYLRSLGEDQRSQVASLERDFPELWPDFTLPSFVPADRLFSTVLRLSSAQLQLWTHYDIMDNVLVQIVGRKRVCLFPPSDVPFLYLTGDKSAVVDVENPDKERFPLFERATRYWGTLEEGDALFIPALWFHNVKALEFSVAINVFWRHLESHFYDPKDVYGNKDLLPAKRAQQGFDRLRQQLQSLPSPYREFHALRFIEQLKEIVHSKKAET